jgi:hypothetical protein
MASTLQNLKEEANTSIQFSYPRVDNIILASDSFFIPNSSTTPSFSLTDGKNNQYISGNAIKGYIATNNIKSSPELILEHQSANTATKFYVVIPLARDSKPTSTLSKLKANSSVSLDLNSDIPLKNTVYHYLENNIHVFVFDKPITIGQEQFKNVTNSLSFVPFITGSSTQTYKIKSNTKIEDEVVCGSVETNTVNSKSAEDVKNTTIVYSVGMFLLCVVLIIISMQVLTNMNADSRFWFAVGSLPIFFIFGGLLIAYAKKPNYAVVFGYMTAITVIIGSMALFPNFFKINKPLVDASTAAKASASVSGLYTRVFNNALRS